MAGVAVCLAGVLRSLPLTARSIAENLIEPLGNADLFIYGPSDGFSEWGGGLTHFKSITKLHLQNEDVSAILRNEHAERYEKVCGATKSMSCVIRI